ncbi:MAG: ABC transporter transmembrane domain-containing protein [Acidobacteriota bacterium]|nr:ABC transporter transmembrane domain-containing protein [Blastocatellia bacterium]MDW8412398.1 ABC transporter transmembrane domain-containing protein [Acidobacteriota bacterium]
MRDLKRLLSYARPHAAKLALGILLTSLVGVFEAGRIALVEPIFDGLAGNRPSLLRELLPLPQESLWSTIAIMLVLLTLLRGMAFFFSGYLLTDVGQRVIVALRQQLYEHILRQSAPFFSKHRSTELTAHIISDVERMQHAVTVLIADLLREGFTLLALLTYAFSLNWKLSAFSLFVAPPIYALTVKFGKRLRRTSHRTQEGIQEVLSTAHEAISGSRIVQAFCMEQFEARRFNLALQKLRRSNMRTAVALYLSSPILDLVGFILLAALILYAQNLISIGSLSVGSFTALLAALFKLYDPMRKLSQTHNNYQQIFAASSRVFALLDEHTEIKDRPGAKELKGFEKDIKLQSVTFTYPGAERPAVEDLNLEIKKGEVVALVGLSGSGKTTLTNLLLRFYEPDSGQILIDGCDIRDISLSSLRAQIAVVSQEVVLFNDTVRNNIAYGRTDVSQEQIEDAARAAYAHDFIIERGGYDQIVGEDGACFSGGQRQRIAVARAILKNAPILVLDEATSALDTESELHLQRALSNLMKDKTTLVIAHRLSTIRNATRIVVMDRGRIIEVGSHEELIAADGLYRRLYELQFAQETEPVGK